MEDTAIVKLIILERLVKHDIWGGKHTPLNFIKKCIPEHYRYTDRRTIKKAFKELINREWIIITKKRTGKGTDDHVSLNPDAIIEIKEFINNEHEKSS